MSKTENGNNAAEFVGQASSSCRKCENFGTSSCPAFRQAVVDGYDADELAEAIRQDQKGESLDPCPNG